MFACFFWQVIALARDGNSPDHRSFAIGAALATTAILIHSWFDFGMHMFGNALLLSAIFGFTAAAEDGRQTFRRVEMGRFARYAWGAAMAGLAVAGVWFVAPTSLASRYTRLGDGAKEELEWDQAEEYYQRAVALDPKSWEAYARLGDTFRARAKWRDAARVQERNQLLRSAAKNYAMAQALNPLNSVIIVGQGEVLEQAGDKEEALKCYQRALELDPNNAFVFAALGRFYRNSGESEKSAEAFKRSLELNWWSDQIARVSLEDFKQKIP